MNLLLDTHVILWFGLTDPKLSGSARLLLTDPDNQLFISAASYWEIAIKIGLGKYRLATDLETFVQQQVQANDYEVLPILPKHARVLTSLPFHHRDPFDRMLVAQAMVEGYSLVSADAALDRYPITRLW